MSNDEINLFNIKIHPWDMQTTINIIESNIINHQINMQHIVINVAKLVNAQTDEALKQAINNSDIVNIDGFPIFILLKMLGYDVSERVTGVDLFDELIRLCATKGYRPYFFGATTQVVDTMVSIFMNKYPELKIAGYRNGYFSCDEEEKIALEIKESKADMLFLGIPSPKKEIFIDKYTKAMDLPFTMGVGGSFDVAAGKTKRAPRWIQKIGFEWFFRICQEPGRMWKRYAKTNPVFMWMAFKVLLKKLLKLY